MENRSYKKLFGDALWGLSAFIVPFAVDTAIGSAIFVGLLWFAWLLGVGKTVGLPQEHLDALQLLHFWLNYGMLTGVGLSFMLRLLRRLFRGE